MDVYKCLKYRSRISHENIPHDGFNPQILGSGDFHPLPDTK